MSRDTFHYPKLLQALSTLPLDTSRDGAPTASLGTLCQRLTNGKKKSKMGDFFLARNYFFFLLSERLSTFPPTRMCEDIDPWRLTNKKPG